MSITQCKRERNDTTLEILWVALSFEVVATALKHLLVDPRLAAPALRIDQRSSSLVIAFPPCIGPLAPIDVRDARLGQLHMVEEITAWHTVVALLAEEDEHEVTLVGCSAKFVVDQRVLTEPVARIGHDKYMPKLVKTLKHLLAKIVTLRVRGYTGDLHGRQRTTITGSGSIR